MPREGQESGAGSGSASADDEIGLDSALSITYAELHAWILGVIGFPAGLGFVSGFPEFSIGLTATAIAIAFGLKAVPKTNGSAKAMAAIVEEPWYFTASYISAYLIGLGIGIGLIRLGIDV